MDVDFFHQEGQHGLDTSGWVNEYEYVTVSGEGHFELLLHSRGFLYGTASTTDTQALVASMWASAQAKMPPNYSDALRTGPVTTAIPAGTKLWLKLPPLPGDHRWGRAKLAGTTTRAAWDELGKYLAAGACELAHANARELLDHVINTPLRASGGVAHANDATLGKALSGDLYFRARFHAVDSVLPVAPDASGQTKVPDWVVKFSQMEGQLTWALGSFRTALWHMGDDLIQLASISRLLHALFDIGNLLLIRDGQWFGIYNPLVSEVTYCQRQVVLPSLPGGDFAFPWSLLDAPVTNSLLAQRTAAIDNYKLLRDAYNKYPAAYVSFVNSLCATESDILSAMVIDGQVGAKVHDEIKSTETWLAGGGKGDPPADAGGLGVLASMRFAKLPKELDPPVNLVCLVATIGLLDGLLTPVGDPGRSALEPRVKGALATVLNLPSDIRAKLMTPTGWEELVKYAKQFVSVDKTAIRAAEMPEAIRILSKLQAQRFRLTDGIAVLRALGFVTNGVNLADDAWTLFNSATSDGDTGKAAEKLSKDTVSAYGTFARDYFSTLAQLKKTTGTLGKDEAASLKALENRFKPSGNLFGVVSGVWTLASGVDQRNEYLTAAGLANILGYGLRRLASREAIAAAVGFDVTVPLLLLGAGLELLNALGPAKADALMRKESVNMLKGGLQYLRNWYERHPPWRPAANADLETALKNTEAMTTHVDQSNVWAPMLPFSDEDTGRMWARLVEIGFKNSEATKLMPTGNPASYALRGTLPTALDPKNWPPNWPSFES